jgi:hypothetical protein
VQYDHWRDEDKRERVMDEAHLAAIKLRTWASEKGVYTQGGLTAQRGFGTAGRRVAG